MSTAFSPYTDWLELPAELTSPNYYELLGLRPLESDTETIATSAERAMSKVRACKPGTNAAAWAQLLDEISAAKECLTDLDQKSSYDQKLQSGEVLEADSTACGNSNMFPPGAAQSSASTSAAETVPSTPMPVAPDESQSVPRLQPAATPDPMDPMAPAPFAVPGTPSPIAPVATSAYPQAIPAAVAQSTPIAPNPMAPAQPLTAAQAMPVGSPVQPMTGQAAAV